MNAFYVPLYQSEWLSKCTYNKDWKSFTRGYNGSTDVKKSYNVKLEPMRIKSHHNWWSGK
ncbi:MULTISPECIES: N-acetylmuramidase domain-containing protein [Acinetobacter]|uniref:N-acetylmuramidase domain-containing protein n=1 Tax=Acinetobacter TaxID=469 RepID=UPI001D184268|nr:MULTISPECIES: N-acetylmuramidase domain-containing protein [Acinetobacter]